MARTKKKIVCKEPIKLWFKPLPSGNRSIYLFIRRGTKKEYEHLNLILIPETDQISKLRNEQTLQLARRIHAERILTLNSEEHGFVNTSSKSKVNLIMYIEKLANDNFERTGTKRGYNENILCLKRHLIEYYGTDQIPFKTVNESFVRGFISYLREAKNMSCNPPNRPLLAQNTRHKLYAQLKTVISHALRDSIIKFNPFMKIDASDKPKEEESKREYLTVGEMKKLVKTDCRNDNVKRAFMFCCFTGLRYGDVKRLAWNDLHTDNNGDTEIQFKQQKTKGVMYLQVSNEALKWLPERNGALGDEKIFQIPINNYLNKALNRWVQSAGISKKITFHCSRHTAATLNLSLGVPIEVVSKLMGHTMIRTTQIYGKIVSEARRNAVNKQNGILDA